MPLDIPLEKAVWTYHREGIDYGPFSSDEIVEQLGEDELSRTDVLLEHSTNRVLKIDQVPAFLPALEASEKRRWEQKLDNETKRSFSEIRRGQQRRPVLVLSLLALSVIVGWFMYARMAGSGASGTVAYALVPVTPPLDLEFLAFASIPEAPQVAEVETKAVPRRTSHKRTTKPRTSGLSAKAVEPEPVVTTIDFSDPEVMDDSDSEAVDGPAPLGHSEFQRYRTELQPKLRNCIRNHNQKMGSGSYRLEFKVLRDGSSSQARLNPASADGRDLLYCVNSLLRMNKIRAFSGGSRDLSLGFQVAAHTP